jgi:hypothetical protein
LIAKVKSYNFEDISTRINQLIQLVETADNMQIVAAMKDIVPEFRSHNSSFKALDVEKKFRSHINVIK